MNWGLSFVCLCWTSIFSYNVIFSSYKHRMWLVRSCELVPPTISVNLNRVQANLLSTRILLYVYPFLSWTVDVTVYARPPCFSLLPTVNFHIFFTPDTSFPTVTNILPPAIFTYIHSFTIYNKGDVHKSCTQSM